MPVTTTKVESHNQQLGFDQVLFRQQGYDPAPARQNFTVYPEAACAPVGTAAGRDIDSYPFLPRYHIAREGSAQVEISTGLKAGDTASSLTGGVATALPANKSLVAQFSTSGQATFTVEVSANAGSTWTVLDTLSLPGGTNETRNYTADGSAYLLRFNATAVQVAAKLSVISQVRGATRLVAAVTAPGSLPSAS